MRAVDLEARRMDLRGRVRLAGEAVAKSWPLRTFVHHNPLVSLESQAFGEAVRIGQKRLGGRGYLSCEAFRSYLQVGRIQPSHLDAVLARRVHDERVDLGPCEVSHRETLRACLAHGFCCDAPRRTLDASGSGTTLRAGDTSCDSGLLDALADRLSGIVAGRGTADRITEEVHEDQAALGRDLTLSEWCDQTFGSSIVLRTNDELIKWCGAFLDEGHATWPMPKREFGFYRAWKALAAHERSPAGLGGGGRKIARLPEFAEDALLESLEALGIPEPRHSDYLASQLAALPGWSGFIKWRAEQHDYPWQQAYPVSLVKYLAVRLWYERELVSQACRAHLGIDGTFTSISAYMRDHPEEYFRRKAGLEGRPVSGDREADRLLRCQTARRLIALAQALDIVPTVLLEAPLDALATWIAWQDAFAAATHGPLWLEAFEAGYQEQILGMLSRTARRRPAGSSELAVRPQSQSLYCIDVRTEPFRRHLESVGNHETFAFAGFFAAPLRFRAWGAEHDTEQCPAVTRPRSLVREIPRSYRDHVVSKHRSRAGILDAAHALAHDLKENVVTPFVMVESLGWFYGLPLVGKTLWPGPFGRLTAWARRLLVPSVATSLTVDKLIPEQVDEMLAAEQRAIVWKAIRSRVGFRAGRLSPDFAEALRLHSLSGADAIPSDLARAAGGLGIAPEALTALVQELRDASGIDERSASRQRERLTRAGFTIDEQVVIVTTLLRIIGLTAGFARLVLICAHGSTSSNNPYEAALDCGACGGNAGKPNARVVAMMANNPLVRARLRADGLELPDDTHFVAGQLDTTTDRVELLDLEDVPATHRKDVSRLQDDLAEAGKLTSQERLGRLPGGSANASADVAWHRVKARSTDWSQVRPEWGLSGNAALVIGPRSLTRGLNLGGRAFMHSYDWRDDPAGRWLEVILTGPQLVCEWINLEHYFSAIDNEVYGSGSKVYHNVVGRVGVMSGPSSDLRVGLARQAVMNGSLPFHEPMRLLTVVEAPRARLDALIARHELLQRYYHHAWVHLVVLDPDDGRFYRYDPDKTWIKLPHSSPGDASSPNLVREEELSE